MSRTPNDPVLRKEMCQRLSLLLKTAYDDNWSQLAFRLGYANPSSIMSVRRGKSFPDVQRLSLISDWIIEGKYRPSVDWILCNQGPAVVRISRGKIVEGLSLTELAAKRAMKRKI